MKSVSQHLFTMAPRISVPRSKFVQPSNYKTAFDSGYLIPFYVDEALPGDTFVGNFTAFGRLSTPVVPFMDNLYLDFQFFAVPNRLLWDNWVKMMGERRNPNDSIDYLVPTITTPASTGEDDPGGIAVGSLYDYMGIPPNVPRLEFSALWPRAYNLIWNIWYRDQNVQDSVTENYGDGPDSPSDYVLLPRGKRKDYFTSCYLSPQKGDSVSIPLGAYAPVVPDGEPIQYVTDENQLGKPLKFELNEFDSSTGDGFAFLHTSDASGYANGQHILPLRGHTGLQADLSQATAATINSLRQAFQLQRLLERDNLGTRYPELLQAHFSVTNPDARMQRPEYLGGGSIPIQVHSVAQTSSTDNTTPQGNLAAFGVTAGKVGFSKSFTEHCVVLGLVSVRADLTYQQGLHRMWSRRGRYDFYWPVLSHLGEQAVLNKEIYAQGGDVWNAGRTALQDDEVFGYQERWSEYKYGVSMITGKLRSTVQSSLDVWHLAQKFDSLPALNATFVQDKPPLSRVLAVQDEPEIIFDCNRVITKVRPMPLYSVPGLIDHF